MADRIQQRRDTAANWAKYNPILLEGEVGYVLDNPNQYKIGDGEHAWNDLPLRGYTGTISQELGDSEDAVVSQAVITRELANTDLINRGIFMPDSYLYGLRGVILDFKVINIDESKEYYIAFIRPKNPLIQIQDETGAVAAQYYPNTPDVTATGIETLTLNPYSSRTEQFRITLNWDAVTDTTFFSKNLHINKKNKEEEENTDLINRGIFMPDSNLNDLPLGAVLNFGVISGISDDKEYYLKRVYATTGFIQIIDQDDNVVSQYYNNGKKSGIEKITVKGYKSATGTAPETFGIFVNWDAAGDFVDNEKHLHINKKNYYTDSEDIIQKFSDFNNQVEEIEKLTLNEDELQETLVVNDKFNGGGIWGLDLTKKDLFDGKILSMWGDELPEEPTYINHIKNIVATYGVLIQISTSTNATNDNVISQYAISNPSEVKTGIEDIVLKKVGTNGKEFHMTVDWDSISNDISGYIQIFSLPKTKGKGVDVETRLDNVETRLDNVETRLDNVETSSEDIIQKFSDFNNQVEEIEKLTLNEDELQETLVVNDKFNGGGIWGLDLTKKDLFDGKILSMWGDELPEEPTYINHIKNIVASNGVLIQISTSINAAKGTVISQYHIASPSEVKTGIEDIVLTKVGNNGKEFHMTVDWDSISNDISGYIRIFSLPKTKNKGVDAETRLDDAETRLDAIFEPIFYDKESSDLTYIENGAILDAWNINCPADVTLYLRYIRNNESPLIQFWYVQNDSSKVLAQYYKPNAQPQTGTQDIKVVGINGTALQGRSFMMRVNWDLIPATNPSPDIIMNTSILRNTPNNNAFARIHELEKSVAPQYLHNELYLNVFGDVIPKSFKKKWFDADKDLEILLLGDSIVGLINSSGEISESEAMFLPPSMNYYHWTWGLWQRIVKNKPVYDRLDAVRGETPSFTKIGDFEFIGTTGEEDKFNLPSTFGEWSVAAKTFQSNSAAASVQFSWDLDAYEKLNIIHSLNPDGAPCKITVSGGDGKVEVSINRTSWVEANNFSVDQNSNPENLNDTQCSQQGHALHQRHRRIWMRKAEGATGVQTITFARTDSDTSKYMYFWGTERWNQSTVIIQNIGRGGRTTALLNQNISDVVDRNPDLVIHSLSLANEQNIIVGTPEDESASLMRNYNDFFFGGNETRPEYIEPRSMLTKSENYTKWAYLVVIPHGRGAYFDGDTLKNESTDLTTFPYYKYRKVGEYIKENGETYDGLSIINLFDQLINEGAYRGMTMEDTFAGTSENPNSFTSDGIHLNRLGSLMWTKYLSPLFDKI